ncbi:hypothetical protein PR048_005306 [Dryococelus australis]|uniref:Reverse transcriptase domain-containing protein n=1 Tax=Dryococelus australis TaxID=614101 RepID=A0ABQ9I7R1_9NEOP|nr:hypothetical protein PR048_005306 [Dryococelus australis]
MNEDLKYLIKFKEKLWVETKKNYVNEQTVMHIVNNNKSSTSKQQDIKLKVNNTLLQDDSENAEAFNSYFTNIAIEIASRIHKQLEKTATVRARVVPIHKSGGKSGPGNYRPISIFSPLSKIIEKIIKNRLLEHFNKHQYFYPYQEKKYHKYDNRYHYKIPKCNGQ